MTEVRFTEPERRVLSDLIYRLNPRAQFNIDEVVDRIVDLLIAIGHPADDSVFSTAFREAVASKPTHRQRADVYRAMSRSTDPLNSKWFKGTIVTAMEVQARLRWDRGRPADPLPVFPRSFPRTFLRDKMSKDFSPDQLNEIRSMAASLAQYEAGLAPPGSRQKIEQDTLLMELADLYLQASESTHLGRFDLPFAESSFFIQFVCAAARPFFDQTLVSPGALSKRWKRLKDRHLVE